MEIYLYQDGERVGPFTLENVQGRLEGGQLTVSDAAWFEGCEDWVTVQDVPGIMLPGGDHLVEVATVPPFDAYQGDEPYVFISYAHKDAAVVYEEITRLHEAGVNVWYDEGIEASNEWPEEIARAVVDCTAFLVFVSPRATASVNCRNEINLALNKDKPFLGIYLEATELPLGLQLRMGDLQAILRYKLPVDRYQRKTQDSLDQLLGKKPARSRTRPPIAQQTEATHAATTEPAEQAVQTPVAAAPSKPRRKGLIVALASILLIACGALGYLFLGDDGDETSETSKPESTATFTPGQPWTVPTASIDMIWCKPGTFLMGSPESEVGRGLDRKGKKKWDETRHKVTLTKGFYLGKYEVTQAQWKKVMGTSPSEFPGDDRPVEQVSWTEAKSFCWKLTLSERKAGRLPDGWEYALPTEAQWEYACRAGTTTVFAFGDSLSSKQANFSTTKPYGGAAKGPNLEQTTAVGSYAANPWGFFDMHGNVREWCADWMGNYQTGSLADPIGSASGSDRVIRGGSWSLAGHSLRSAGRYDATPDRRNQGLGFRLSLRQVKVEQPKVPTPGQPWTVPTASIEMLWCKPGDFMMGSPESEKGRELDGGGKKKWDETQHEVTLTKGFYLGKHEVTQAQWKKVMGASPSKFPGDDRPVEQVSWTDVMTFCQELTLAERKAGRLPEGWEYALPTEAQWEYACRAGTTTVFSFGDSLSSRQANFKGTEPYGGAEAGAYLERATDVGSYSANAWGFHDMHGNVREWCSDWYGDYPSGTVRDPMGPAVGSWHVVRGGSWGRGAQDLRSAFRAGGRAGFPDFSLGFRLSLQQTKVEQPTPGQPWTVPTASIEMLWCKPGDFMMGSPESEKERELDYKGKKTKYYETQHQVTLTKGFYLGKYEVTQAQWKKVMATSPSKFFGEDRPVEQVNWTEAGSFCWNLTLSERKAGRLPDGWEYTLPTEAQWEYACRAGTTTVFAFGDSLSSKQANFKGTSPYGGAKAGPLLERTTDVGSYPANPWGFFDMHGNVWEWCADRYGKSPSSAVTDPTGAASGSIRVNRGGSWDRDGHYLRSALRLNRSFGTRFSTLGFRLSLRQVGK